MLHQVTLLLTQCAQQVGYEDGHVAVWAAAAPAQPVVAKQLHKEPIMALTLNSSAAGAHSLSHCVGTIRSAARADHKNKTLHAVLLAARSPLLLLIV